MPIQNKEPIISSRNKYIRLLNTLLSVVRSSRIPLYSCKYSRKTYTQHQHPGLILLKEILRMDYRSIVEVVDLMTPVREVLKLETVPHFTTLQKFMTRIRSFLFNVLLS